ncbi:MAG: Helix-turn-helix domain protein [Parcubacteria group bacterium ADurb.Bin216]|nr:MAG: Helix-turn-helix domain protein [Parcubacteria group bacterium ADurb.Bin216]
MINKYFDLIKAIRIEKGFSQEEISQKIGISRTSYISFEKGKTELTFSQAAKVAGILGISLEEVEGGVRADYDKYKQMVLAYLRSGEGESVTKTKLAKMLYLADFAWFYDKLESMSGMKYRKMQYGPVSDMYFRALDELEEAGKISISRVDDSILISENRGSKKSPLDKLDNEEKELIEDIYIKWKDKKTREIVDFTHNQLPYRICASDEIIPYELITQEDPDHVY